MTSHHKNNKPFYKITRHYLLSVSYACEMSFWQYRKKIHWQVQIHIPFTIPKTPCFNTWSLAMKNALFSPISVYHVTRQRPPQPSNPAVCQTTYPICSMGTTKLFSSTTCSTRYLYKISFTIPNVIALVSVWSDVLSQVLHELCLHHVTCRPTCSMV